MSVVCLYRSIWKIGFLRQRYEMLFELYLEVTDENGQAGRLDNWATTLLGSLSVGLSGLN